VAASQHILEKAMRLLLGSDTGQTSELNRIILLEDAFRLADKTVCEAAEQAVFKIAEHAGLTPERVEFADVVRREVDLIKCNEAALRNLQTLEFQSTVGAWIENNEPELGSTFSMAYQNVRAFDRTRALSSVALCERLFEGVRRFLHPGTLVCFPTTPTIAPMRGALSTKEAVSDFYSRTMAVTSFSGVGRVPEISAPLLTAEGCPVGLSMAAGQYQDEFLLRAARQVAAFLS